MLTELRSITNGVSLCAQDDPLHKRGLRMRLRTNERLRYLNLHAQDPTNSSRSTYLLLFRNKIAQTIHVILILLESTFQNGSEKVERVRRAPNAKNDRKHLNSQSSIFKSYGKEKKTSFVEANRGEQRTKCAGFVVR